jgi:hypothetical protein
MGWGYGHISAFGQFIMLVAFTLYAFWPYIIMLLLTALILFVVKLGINHQKNEDEIEDLL